MALSKAEEKLIDSMLQYPDEVFIQKFKREQLEEIYFEIYNRYPSANLTKSAIVRQLRMFVNNMERTRMLGAGLFIGRR